MANYRYLGYGITNNEGVATLDHDAQGNPINHSYTGTGAGEIDIVASLDDSSHISDSSLQSEIYELIDGTFKDMATLSDHNDNWYIRLPNLTTITREANGTVIEWTGPYPHVIAQNGTYYTVPMAFEFDLLSNTNGRIQLHDGSNATVNHDITLLGHYKVINNLTNQYIYVNGQLITSYNRVLSKSYFAFVTVNPTGGSVKYANFVAYPI